MNSDINTKLTVPDIVCGGCANAIKNALGKVDGILKVDVDIEAKEVSVEHGEKVGRGQIIEALDQAGFPAA
ncbi:MAG: heavy-metal-associated domain-containing protein [Blastocatellia bacterium]|nr:heavy-metal-associated domain-containing protein [Chloracidobacterium sp.]MBL8184508.1 heavy-metal-associated domain-containing protein [Blastocatellia bacterium]HBE82754.1 heavy metal transport/detoxification protein [Blastocatellia bacterium]HRJ87667.1 heavy-metal-associated domain-containing protein [Pyrinomonadaceae bacterium]HRK51968.1 heavy-metal-associated domain-containing protein [Pyrinomonadaceae bacterium]